MGEKNIVHEPSHAENPVGHGQPLTAEALADALDCFCNAALGAAQDDDDAVAFRAVRCVASGLEAVSLKLRSSS